MIVLSKIKETEEKEAHTVPFARIVVDIWIHPYYDCLSVTRCFLDSIIIFGSKAIVFSAALKM